MINYIELADSIIDNSTNAKENLKQQYIQCRKDWQETPISEDEYYRFSSRLATTKVDYDKVLGYTAISSKENLVYCKYNKKTENFVVYVYINNSPIVITFFKKSWREYEGDKWVDYYDEIPSGK